MARTSKRKINALQNLYSTRIKERLREEEVCQNENKENEGPLEDIFASTDKGQSKKKLKWEDMILKNIRAKEAKAKLLGQHSISKPNAGPSRQVLGTIPHNANTTYNFDHRTPKENSTNTQSSQFCSSEAQFPPNAPQQSHSISQPNTTPPTIVYGAQFITFPVETPPQPVSTPSPIIETPSPPPTNRPPQPPPKTRQAALVELAAQIRIATAICEALSQKANTATQEASIADSLAMTTAGMVASFPTFNPYREAARMAAHKAYEAKVKMEKLKEQEAEARGILMDLVGQYNEAKPVGGRGRPGPGRKR